MTTVQWLTLIVFFITIAAIVRQQARCHHVAGTEFFDFICESCVSPSCVEFCVSSIGRSKCQSSNTILEDWY